MNYRTFYDRLLEPIERQFGRFDDATLTAIIGFDAGGPLSLRTIHQVADGYVTYVSCELAVREEQVPCSHGRYELMTTVHSERWARSVLTALGSISLETCLDDGHTVDLAGCGRSGNAIEAIVIERVATVEVDRKPYSVLACHGLTRPELEYAQLTGGAAILDRLKAAGIYPRTILDRQTVRLDA